MWSTSRHDRLSPLRVGSQLTPRLSSWLPVCSTAQITSTWIRSKVLSVPLCSLSDYKQKCQSALRHLYLETLTVRHIVTSLERKRESSLVGLTFASRGLMKFIFRGLSQNSVSGKSGFSWNIFSPLWRWLCFLIWLYCCRYLFVFWKR